jgi:preprotein translocase subunit SecA
MNQQRDVIYSQRKFALEKGEELTAEAIRMVEGALVRLVDNQLADVRSAQDYDRPTLHSELLLQYLVSAPEVLEPAKTPDLEAIQNAVHAEGLASFQRKREYLDEFAKTVGVPDVYQQVLSNVMLTVLDEKWKDHLYDLDHLKSAIHFRALGQRDPLVEYKREAFEMFEDLMRDIHSTFTERFLKIQVSAEPPRPSSAPPSSRPTSQPPRKQGPEAGQANDMMPGAAPDAPPPPRPAPRLAGLPATPAPTITAPVGRNDPCPCGSGKKYKKCHGATG